MQCQLVSENSIAVGMLQTLICSWTFHVCYNGTTADVVIIIVLEIWKLFKNFLKFNNHVNSVAMDCSSSGSHSCTYTPPAAAPPKNPIIPPITPPTIVPATGTTDPMRAPAATPPAVPPAAPKAVPTPPPIAAPCLTGV